ncbi:MAG: single-stranded-DNA-specific exonuclease RecJ [Trueperaceae bacterium]|nr:MAG: single-stranded-DNA-specific exonuclease RecJ [Trueperaceae bacterium]
MVASLSRELRLPPLLAGILWGRGFGEEAVAKLNPPLRFSPIPNVEQAAVRLEQAIRNKERILVHGDYDADGICGTAVLTLGLRALGGHVLPFLPNRLKDGYGIHPKRVSEHAERADLFLTVDCGISNHAEIAQLQAAGLDVIVTDHHHVGQELPPCLVVHPKLAHTEEEQPDLTGAGVAFHLLWAVHNRFELEPPFELSDIAMIGTIADVAPLLGENRALIQEGLRRLTASRWPGLQACLKQIGIRHDPTARDIAFILAPRLNAAGRLGEADLGLELLLTASERRARELAAYLDARNSDRQRIQKEMFEVALNKVDPDAPALVIEDAEWHPGVMGIVASNLVERFFKPVFIIAGDKGSVRSTPGISAVEGLRYASAHLQRFGGHAQAAGFAIAPDQIKAFRAAIYDFVNAHPKPEPSVTADALVSVDEIDDALYQDIKSLEPFGEGYQAPLFALADVLDTARAVGNDGGTLQLRIGGLKGVAWRKGELAKQLTPGRAINAAITLRETFWKNRRSLEFIAEEVRDARWLTLDEPEKSPLNVHRGPPDEQAGVVAVTSLETLQGHQRGPIWLRNLPMDRHPCQATSHLHRLVGSGFTLYFDLDEPVLASLEERLRNYPTVSELRRAYVNLSNARPLPFGEIKSRLVRSSLNELDLIDRSGRAVTGQKRNPYSSNTFLGGLLERYKIRTFVNAYRYYQEESFAQVVQILFGRPPSVPSADGEDPSLPAR